MSELRQWQNVRNISTWSPGRNLVMSRTIPTLDRAV